MKEPWKIILDTDGKTYIEDTGGERVAEVYGRLVDPNCFLIKAAPELLEALQDIASFCEAYGELQGVVSQANRAIKKAKGGAE